MHLTFPKFSADSFSRGPLCLMYVPEALLETVNKVVTPNVVLPATESTSIQNETHDMTTIKIVGKYD